MSTASSAKFLIEPRSLETQLYEPNLKIVQICSEDRFKEGHVPGAHWVPPQALILGAPPFPGTTPTLAQINTLLQSLHITPDTRVVALDDEGGGWAGRFLWTLSMVGHENWQLLNGGLVAWVGEGFALSTTDSQRTSEPLQTNAPHQWGWAEHPPAVDADTLKAHLGDANWVIWDARSQSEYMGIKTIAKRSGHIPGAKHYEWTQAMDQANHLKLRDLEQIKKELAHTGITENQTIVTHCHSHHRSGFTWALGKILGFEQIKAFPGSWAQWGNSEDLPVET